MDIRSKVEARKAELREQLARQQEKDSQAAQAESARRLAHFDEVAAIMPHASTATAPDEIASVSDSFDSSTVDAEIDKELDKRAQNNWTQGENKLGCGLVIVAFGSFFINWMLGVGLIFVALIYFGMTQSKHKKKLRADFDRVLKAKDLDTQASEP